MRQRTDSTHVVAAIRDMNRLERVVEPLRATLNVIATVAPDWMRSQIPAEWVDRYARRAEDDRVPAEATARETWATRVGADGHVLLAALWALETPEERRTPLL